MKRFKKIYIEITNVCNLKCTFCSETKRTAEFMNLESFRKIVEQIKPYTDHVCFHVKGEPLLHPAIDQFLDLCYEKGLKVNISTNGTLIHKAADKLIMKPALRQVSFSIHSYDGNELKESDDEYLSRIIAFIRQVKIHSDPIISLRLWNLDWKDGITNKTSKNLDILTKIESAFQLPFKIIERANQTRGINITDKVFLNQDFQFEWPSPDKEEDFGKGFCYALKSHVAILVDGTVVPCCLDGDGLINLGNIHTTPFAEIIESGRAVTMLRGFSNKEVTEALCRKCTYRKRFDKIQSVVKSV